MSVQQTLLLIVKTPSVRKLLTNFPVSEEISVTFHTNTNKPKDFEFREPS